MSEGITSFHRNKSPPATQNTNKQRIPIDGIWVSNSISVLAAGYYAFGNACPSDHRALWIDLDKEQVYGHRPKELHKPVQQRLTDKDPRLKRGYTKRLKKAYSRSHIPQKFEHLQRQYANRESSNFDSEEFIEAYNLFEKQILSIRQEVEKQIRVVKRGEVPWSPKLQVKVDTVDLWLRVIKREQGLAVSGKTIERLMKKTGLFEAKNTSLETAIEKVKVAFKDYYKFKHQAPESRNAHNQRLADALAEQNASTRAQELRKMGLIEQQRRNGRIAKSIRGRGNKQPVVKVTARNAQGEEVEYNDMQGIVEVCAKSNLTRQMKAHDTPFLQSPLIEEIGYQGEGHVVPDILSGQYEPPDGIDNYAAELLQAMRMPEAISRAGPIQTTISRENHRSFWLRQSSRTASEPSHLSFAHYKIACEDNNLCDIDAFLREAPLQVGFSPDTWRKITDVEILKKLQVFDVDKMRLIQLMVAPYNANNKMLGRAVMRQAEDCEIIAPDQYGSRKFHRSNMAALNKRLAMDLLRQKRQSGIISMNDAEGCFDRIGHPVDSIAMQRLGVPLKAMKCLLSTLQKASHCIATGFGVSEPAYGGVNQIPPIQGSGQGNGRAPQTWVLIHMMIISMMYKAGHGVKLFTALTVTAIAFVCFAFVDDTDVVQTGDTIDTPYSELIPDFQEALDRWAGGLRATGGALVPQKSYWYLIDFHWTGTEWRYKTITETPGDLTLLNKDQTSRTTITRYEVGHAEETLGVFLAMDGNNQRQIEELKKKSKEFGDQVRVSNTTPSAVWYTYSSSFLKSLEYPMSATTISKKEWDQILQPAIQWVLPKIGLARNTPRDMLYSPLATQGFGALHPWHKQEITHIMDFLDETTNNSLTGKLMQATVEQLRMEVGSNLSFMEMDYLLYEKLATESHIKLLWRYCNLFEIGLPTPQNAIPLLRQEDSLLIDDFIRCGIKGKDLERANQCRLWLRAFSAADIATCDGRSISQNALNGVRSNGIRICDWPRRPPELSSTHWAAWKSALIRCYSRSTGSRVLKERLGEWTTASVNQLWNDWFALEENRLYRKEGLLWRVWLSNGGRARRHGTSRFYKTGLLVRERPPSSMMASVYIINESTIGIEATSAWTVAE